MFSEKFKLSRHTGGRGPRGGRSIQCHQMTHGGGAGSKIGQQCHVSFEWPHIEESAHFEFQPKDCKNNDLVCNLNFII